MPSPPELRAPVSSVRKESRAVVLICSSCPAGRKIRRRVKAAVKSEQRKSVVRVIACGCLDVCPKRGAAALIASSLEPVRRIVIAGQADGAAVLTILLNERMRDAVAN